MGICTYISVIFMSHVGAFKRPIVGFQHRKYLICFNLAEEIFPVSVKASGPPKTWVGIQWCSGHEERLF